MRFHFFFFFFLVFTTFPSDWGAHSVVQSACCMHYRTKPWKTSSHYEVKQTIVKQVKLLPTREHLTHTVLVGFFYTTIFKWSTFAHALHNWSWPWIGIWNTVYLTSARQYIHINENLHYEKSINAFQFHIGAGPLISVITFQETSCLNITYAHKIKFMELRWYVDDKIIF